MKIIESPSEEQLNQLQEVLGNEQNAGIVDIFGPMVSVYLGAEDAGSLVGVASISLWEECAELYKLYVAPSHRRRGIGRALAEATIEYLKVRNIRELDVEISGRSRDFWESFASRFEILWYSHEKFGITVPG